MATSGSFTTNYYNQAAYAFSWNRASYSIQNNTTTINWTLTAIDYQSSTHFYYRRKTYVNVAGERRYTQGDGTIKPTNGQTIASGTVTINMNSDGTGSFSADAGGAIYVVDVNCTGSGTWTLDTIPRYTSITSFSVSKVSGSTSSLKFNWATANTIDYLWYSTNGGSTWIGYDVSDGTTGSFNVTGLNANTTYSCKIRVRRKDSQLTTDSSTVSQTTYDIARISSASNFNFSSNATLNITNPAGISQTITMKIGSTTILTRSASTGANTITFTQAELDNIYKKFGSANSVSIVYSITSGQTATVTCTLTGVAKTIHIGVNNASKRGQVWIGVNGVPKRAVVWIGVNGVAKRCI